MKLTLSWPEPCLWPNRANDYHWAAINRARRDARHEAKIVTLAALDARIYDAVRAGQVHIAITGHKPNMRRRDLQNLQAALKAHMDGIADALGIDDEHFVLSTDWGDDAPPRGAVTVEL